MRYSVLLAGILAVAATISRPVYASALTCGTEIRVDITLTSDLGPCTGRGLTIIGGNVTLDLAGHNINGTGSNAGVFLVGGGVIIKGPGWISNFDTGIYVSGPAGPTNVMIYDLVLFRNTTGIYLNDTGRIRIFDNFVLGGNRGVNGISTQDVGQSYFYRNTVTGHSNAGALLISTNAMVDENVMTGNQVGVTVLGGLQNPTVQGNQVFRNRGDGISFVIGYGPFVIADNDIHDNGGNGISAQGGGSQGASQIVDNLVRSNSGYGVGIDYGSNIQVSGNRMSGNGTDLYWSGAGVNNCSYQNLFQTTSPSVLPPCF
jgi:nitrous oxidase accessory protein NosD